MRVKVRGYEGILDELSSGTTKEPYTGKTRLVAYCVWILLDDGARVEIEGVQPHEIEVLDD